MTLAPEFLLATLVAFAGALGSFFAVKYGQQETQRLVKALHGRFDKLEGEVNGIKIQQARQDERIKGIKESQRFRLKSKLALAEADMAGQAPMFAEEDDSE